MPTPDPHANDPYEVLGVTKSTPLDEIKEKVIDLLDKTDNDTEIKAFNEAWKEIKKGPSRQRVKGTLLIDLVVEVQETNIQVGDEITIFVEDDRGVPVDDASLKLGDKRKGRTTNGKGTARVDTAGEHTITAEKRHPEKDKHYRDATTKIEADRRETHLRFAHCPDVATVGDEIDVQVTNGDMNGQGGVSVKTPNHVSNPTDTDGWTSVKVTKPGGGVTIKATKKKGRSTKYIPASTSIEVRERTVQMEFDNVPNSVSVGDTVSIRVVDSSGTSLRGVTVSNATDSETTDDSGIAELSFAGVSPGQMPIKASKRSRGGVAYEEVSRKIDVKKPSLTLELQVITDSPKVGEPARFLVRDSEGNRVEGALVSGADADNDLTDAHGEATLVFTSAGRKTVTVSRTDQSDKCYSNSTEIIEIGRKEKSLEIVSFDRNLEVGEEMAVKVTDENDVSIAGVEVKGKDGTIDTTGRSGQATIEFEDDGRKRLSATKQPDEKAEYEPDSVVVDVDERTKSVNIQEYPKEVAHDEEIKIRVVDEMGSPVADAQIIVRDQSDQRLVTDSDGWAAVVPDVDSTGFVTVVTRTDRDQFQGYDQINVRVKC